MARLVYDLTLRFCDKYIGKFFRTHDQMVQAARSGVQNIAEGSQASATSKKTEIKLTQVARASLEELKLDYEDFLRQRDFSLWENDNIYRQELVDNRFETVDEISDWIIDISGRYGRKGQSGRTLTASDLSTVVYPEISANSALTLINVACYLLDQQVRRLADDFEKEGGFTERLYNTRKDYRKNIK